MMNTPTIEASAPPSPGRARVYLAALVLIAFVVFVQADFFWDDHTVIDPEGPIADFSNLERVFSQRCLLFDHSASDYPYYRPLVDLLLILEFAVVGQHPLLYHATSFLLHLANVLLCFELLRRIVGGAAAVPAAWLGAAIFGLHPLQCESVLWIAARPAVLSLFFLQLSLAALLALNKARMGSRSRVAFWAFLVLLSYVGALFSKEVAVLAPLPALILWMERDIPRHRALGVMHAALVAATLGYLILNSAGSGQVALRPTVESLAGFADHVAHALGFYSTRLFVPLQLAPGYSLSLYENPVYRVLGLLALTGVVLVAGLAWRRRSYSALLGLTGLLYFLGSAMIPVATGLIALADRYLYQSLWGLGLAVAVLAARAAGSAQFPPARLWLWGWIGALVLTGLTLRQSAYWWNGQLLWSRVLELDPQNEYAGYFVGGYWEGKGEYDRAIAVLQPVVFVEARTQFRIRYAAAVKLGKLLFYQGRAEDALRAYDKALASPEFYPQGRIGQAIVEHTRGQNVLAREVLAEFRDRQDLVPSVCLDLARLALRAEADVASAQHWYLLARQQGEEPDPEIEAALATDPIPRDGP